MFKSVLIICTVFTFLVSCSFDLEPTPVILKIRKSAVRSAYDKWGVKAAANGHVTLEGHKIPMIRFSTNDRIDSQKEALQLYKKVYYELASTMEPSKSTEAFSWNKSLFIEGRPKVWMSLVFHNEKDELLLFPKVTNITMSPKDILNLSSIDPETQKFVDIHHTSLRELFKEELASDQMEPSAEE